MTSVVNLLTTKTGSAARKEPPAESLSKQAVLPLAMPAHPSYAATVMRKPRLHKHKLKFVL